MVEEDPVKIHEESEAITGDWSNNPFKQTIADLFSGPFSGNNYKSISLDHVKMQITDKLLEKTNGTVYYRQTMDLIRKVNKQAATVSILKILEEALFS